MSIIHFGTSSAAVGVTGAGVVTISDQTVANIFTIDPSTASAGVKLTRGGQYHTGYNDAGASPSYADVGGSEWAAVESASVGDAYECRMVTGTGTTTTGTRDSWLAMTSDREWTVVQSGNGTKAFTGTLEIRLAAGSTLDSAAISLTAFVDVI